MGGWGLRRHMFDKETIGKMKKGSWLVNNARGAICDPPAVVEALESGHLRGLPYPLTPNRLLWHHTS